MSKHSYGANSEMLLLLAWSSTLNLQEQLRKDQRERSWKYPQLKPWEQQWKPAFPEELLQEHITRALDCFQGDPIYGPVLEAMVRFRLTFIDFSLVAWAISLEELADASSALFFSDEPYYQSRRQEKDEIVDETDAFWRVAQAHIPLIDRLRRLSKAWHGDICQGACELRSFFGWYLDLARRSLQMPFFVHEFLRISLQKIDWHVIAAKVLEVALLGHAACCCAARTQEVLVGARAEYLGELFRQTGDEAIQLGQCLPEPELTQALLLAELCRETTRAMRQGLMDTSAC